MSKDRFDKWESVTNTLKNIFFIFGFLVIVILIVILLPKLKSQIKSTRIESLEIVGIKLHLYNELNISKRVKGEEQIEEMSKFVKVVAEILNYEGIFWVYLGTTTSRGNKENWFTKCFTIVIFPKNGDIIEAIADIFEKVSEPKIKDGVWTKGEIQGLIKREQKVKVIEIVEIPGTQNRSLWWVKVPYLNRAYLIQCFAPSPKFLVSPKLIV